MLYHFPPLFALAAQVAGNHVPPAALPLSGREFRAAFFRPEIASHWLHFTLAAVATSGIMLLGFALRCQKKGLSNKPARLAAWGARIALFSTLLQIPAGLWLLASLPSAALARFTVQLGVVTLADGFAPVALLVSVVAALWLMHVLAGISFGAAERKHLVQAMALLVLIVWLMSAALVSVRDVLGERPVPVATSL